MKKKHAVWVIPLILIILVLAVNLIQAPPFKSFRCDEKDSAETVVILDRGMEYRLNRVSHQDLIQQIVQALFDRPYRRLRRADNATYSSVRLIFADESGAILWEGFVSGNSVVDNGYFYIALNSEESIKDLIAEAESRCAVLPYRPRVLGTRVLGSSTVFACVFRGCVVQSFCHTIPYA